MEHYFFNLHAESDRNVSVGVYRENFFKKTSFCKLLGPWCKAVSAAAVLKTNIYESKNSFFRNFSLKRCFLIETLCVWAINFQLIHEKEFNHTCQMIPKGKVFGKGKTFWILWNSDRILSHMAVSKWYIPVLTTTFRKLSREWTYKTEQNLFCEQSMFSLRSGNQISLFAATAWE